MKKIIFFAIICTFIISSVASAAPLYDYRLGHFAVSAGYWSNFVGSNIIGGQFEKEIYPNYYQYANNTSGTWDASATVGLGHNFAIRYGYSNMNGTYSRNDSQNTKQNYNTTISYNEIDIYYRLASSLNDLPNDFLGIFDSSKPQRSSEANGNNVVALYIGGIVLNGSTSNNSNPNNGSSVETWSPTIGVETAAELTSWLVSTSKLALSSSASYYGELGLSFIVAKGASIDVQYNTMDSIADAAFLAKSGMRVGLTYQY